MPTTPKNKTLYNKVKALANKKFKSPTGVYRSSWIVKEYKKRGGTYSSAKPKKSTTGLKRWYKEKWVDLNRPIRSKKSGKITGYKPCGRKSARSGKYPACRPSKRITRKTPKTYKELSKKSIRRSRKLKTSYKQRKNVKW